MALRHVDSFDHYVTADILEKGYTHPSNALAVVAGAGRNGTAGIRRASNQSGRIRLTLDAQPTWITGFGFYMDSAPGTNTASLFDFADAGTLQVELRVDTTGHLVATRNGTTLATGSAVLTAATYYHIAIKVMIADAGGRFIVKVNNVVDIDFTGDTKNTANASANMLELGSLSALAGSGIFTYDDWYVMDGTGAANNDFPADADLRVACLLPNGNGASSQFTGSDGNSVDNYLLVDEAAPNDDTDYVASGTVGHIDTYAMADLPSSAAAIQGIQQVIAARKDDAGSRTGRTVLRRSGVNYEGADIALANNYLFYTTLRETDPSTAAAWTEAGVNAIEAGAKVQS